MAKDKETRKEPLSQLDLSKIAHKEQITNTVAMTVEFMKYQGEVAYEIGKKQAISIASTASSISIGWSAFFFGIAMESWAASSIGLMMVLAGTFLLGFWTPRVLEKARGSLDELAAAKFVNKWFSEAKNSGAADTGQHV